MLKIKAMVLLIVSSLLLAACSQVSEVPREGLESTTLKPGSFDPTFDKDGKLILNVGGSRSEITDVAVQADGKIVVVGYREINVEQTDGIVARFLPDGKLDPSFGSNGQFIFQDIAATSQRVIPNALTLTKAGRILVVATGSNPTFTSEEIIRPIVLGLTVSGQPDPSFDSNGFAYPSTQIEVLKSADITGEDIHVDTFTGEVTIGGTASPENRTSVLWTWKVGASGSPNNEGQGLESTEIVTGRNANFRALEVRSNGEMVILADTTTPNVKDTTPFLVRKAANGTTLAKGHVFLGSTALANDLTLDKEGRIIFTGRILSGQLALHGVVVRVKPDLSFDETFYDKGKHIFWVAANPHDVRVDSQGRIVIAAGDGTFAVMRLDSNGMWDFSFSDDGITKASFEGGPDTATALTLDHAGKIVAAGFATQKATSQAHFALVRFIP